LIVAGALLGNEIAVSAFAHPQISRLDDAAHAASAKALAAVLGRVMPFWYALTLLLSIATTYFLRSTNSAHACGAIVATTLYTLSIVCSIAFLVPINNRIAGLDLAHLPTSWKEDRKKWDRFHRIRVLVLLIALIFLISSVLS